MGLATNSARNRLFLVTLLKPDDFEIICAPNSASVPEALCMERSSLLLLSVSRTQSLMSMHMLADHRVAVESLAATKRLSAEYSSHAKTTVMTL